MTRSPLVLAALVALAACQPQTVNQNWQYRAIAAPPPVPLGYAPGAVLPPPIEAAALRRLGRDLPQDATVLFYGAAPVELERARAEAAGRLVGRPTIPLAAARLGPDQASVAITMPAAIVSDACRGPAQRTAGDVWPGDDASAPVLLPAGCAVETDIAAQTAAPADLVRGRPLPPGASLPYAAAIQRYYDSFTPAAAKDEAPAGNTGGGSTSSSASPADGGRSVNPLLGPLPATGPQR